MAEQPPECPICCTPPRATATCPRCNYTTCTDCLRHFSLESLNPAHCLNRPCEYVFTREELNKLLTRNFVVGPYKDHRKAQLLSLEKSLLTQSQTMLEELWGEDIPGTIDELKDKIEEARKKREDMAKQIEALDTAISAQWAEETRLNDVITRREHTLTIKDLQKRAERRRRVPQKGEKAERKVFVWKCPAPDCRGFLSTQWKCGLCSASVCKECGMIKPEEKAKAKDKKADGEGEAQGEGEDKAKPLHVCKKEDVETMQELKKTTRNCPACGTAINKIGGCDHMWCVNCHVAFSWEKGTLLDIHSLHNPHYAAWQAAHPEAHVRDVGDIGCGGIPYVVGSNVGFLHGPNYAYVVRFRDGLLHHQADIAKLTRPKEDSLLTLRLRYLNQEINESRWMSELMRINKACEYGQRIMQVMNMLLNAGSDLLRNYNEHGSRGDERGAIATVAEMRSLIEYVNGQLALLSEAYELQAWRVKVEDDKEET